MVIAADKVNTDSIVNVLHLWTDNKLYLQGVYYTVVPISVEMVQHISNT